MASKETRISVESLRGVAVLYEGDVYELARLVLRLCDGRDREANARNPRSVVRSRPSVHGLAMHYSMLVRDVSMKRVEQVLVEQGFPLGAIVDDDVAAGGAAEVPPHAVGIVRQGRRRKRSGD